MSVRKVSDHDLMMDCRSEILRVEWPDRDYETVEGHSLWLEAMLAELTDAANRWALRHGRRPITIDQAREADRRAVGHSDYHRKMALYLAEAVVYEEPHS